ncbi:hypothetical protein ACP4OV_013636 [Aristida adscensionis]
MGSALPVPSGSAYPGGPSCHFRPGYRYSAHPDHNFNRPVEQRYFTMLPPHNGAGERGPGFQYPHRPSGDFRAGYNEDGYPAHPDHNFNHPVEQRYFTMLPPHAGAGERGPGFQYPHRPSGDFRAGYNEDGYPAHPDHNFNRPVEQRYFTMLPPHAGTGERGPGFQYYPPGL